MKKHDAGRVVMDTLDHEMATTGGGLTAGELARKSARFNGGVRLTSAQVRSGVEYARDYIQVTRKRPLATDTADDYRYKLPVRSLAGMRIVKRSTYWGLRYCDTRLKRIENTIIALDEQWGGRNVQIALARREVSRLRRDMQDLRDAVDALPV